MTSERYIMGLVDNLENLTGTLSAPVNIDGSVNNPESLSGLLSSPENIIGYLSNATLRGVPVELQVSGTWLQWKYQDETTWRNLININDISYEELQNLPSINGVKLVGNKSLLDLNIASRAEATTSSAGLMSATDKAKLNSVQNGAQANVIETVAVNGYDLPVSGKRVNVSVPTNNNQLTNGAGYQNAAQVENAITAKGYQTSAQVESAITSKGYQTASQVENKIESYGYQDATDVENKVESYGYQTASDVESKVESYGYQTESDVATKVESYGYQTAADVDAVLPKKVSDLTNDAEYTTKQYVDDEIAGITIEVDSTLSQQGKAADAKAVGDAVSRIDGELNSKQDVLDFGTPTSADVGKALMPKTVENGEVTEWEFGEAGKVDDVQVNGVSVLNNKVANVSVPTNNNQLANGAGYQTASDVSSSIVTALGDITTISYHVCTEQEFDPDTLIPTLQGEVGVVYLVPRTDAIAGSAVVGQTDLDEVEENNVYLEFIYVDGEFEKIGAIGDIDLDGYVTDDDIATNQDVEDMLDEIGL